MLPLGSLPSFKYCVSPLLQKIYNKNKIKKKLQKKTYKIKGGFQMVDQSVVMILWM